MRTVIVFDNADYFGRPEKDFFRACLLLQPSLLRYVFSNWLASLLYFFRIIGEEKYLARRWRFLGSVKKLDKRLYRFWKKRIRKYIKTEGYASLISVQPAEFLSPMAQARGLKLYANEYDAKAGAFLNFASIPELYERSGGGDYICDRLHSELMDPNSEIRPSRAGKVYETAGKYRRRLALKSIWTGLILLAASAALGIFCLLLSTGGFGREMFFSYFRVDMLVFLNVLPIFLIALLMYFITNRLWVSALITSFTAALFTLVNYYKILFRNDPLIAEDLTLFFESLEMGGKYNISLNLYTAAFLIFCVFGVIFCFFAARGRIRSPHVRVVGALMTAAVMLFSFEPLYLSNTVYNETTSNMGLISKWSQEQIFISKGFVYPFLHSIGRKADTKPEGYDAAEAARALSEYGYSDIPDGEKVNVIAIMLEAFNDFSKFDELEFSVDVYGTLHELQAEGYSGELVTNIFAGGTVDTERGFLTGFTELGNFRSLTNSYAYYFREQGYFAEGAHGCFEWFYNRININANLGFENYWFVENYYAPVSYDNVAPDYIFLPSIIDLFEAAKAESDMPYFNFSVSYQGHGPYSSEKLTETEYVVNNEYGEQEYNILNNYFDLQYDTNKYLKEMFDYFRASEEPVVIVLFGDHNPWLGDGNSVYNMLGINLDLSTEEGFYNYYSVPYLIWGNDAAKAALGSDIRGEGPSMSPVFLMNELFELFGWEGNEFMKLSNELRSRLDVVHSSGIYREDGILTDTPSEENRAFLDEYKRIEYYWKKNFKFVEAG